MTLHFVCCDRAYCNAPVTNTPEPAATPADVECVACRAHVQFGHCAICHNLYP